MLDHDDRPPTVETASQLNILAYAMIIIVLGFGIGHLGYITIEKYYDRLPQPSPMMKAFGDCGNPCVIKSNNGGELDTFMRAATSLKDGDMVSIDGVCMSACVLFADHGRPYVCVTEKAAFLFHAGYWKNRGYARTLRFHPPHSPDIAQYVYTVGGFTTSEDYADMPALAYPDTLRFWPLCNTGEAKAKEDLEP